VSVTGSLMGAPFKKKVPPPALMRRTGFVGSKRWGLPDSIAFRATKLFSTGHLEKAASARKNAVGAIFLARGSLFLRLTSPKFWVLW
jgi:hypothetical protein